MFHNAEIELRKLQEQLDRERELLERARKAEEQALEPPAPKFQMSDLYVVIPENDTAPMKLDSNR